MVQNNERVSFRKGGVITSNPALFQAAGFEVFKLLRGRGLHVVEQRW